MSALPLPTAHRERPWGRLANFFLPSSAAPTEADRALPLAPPLAVRVPGLAREVHVKIASEYQEWEQAFRLAATNYRRRGYETPDSPPCRFTAWHALPDTTVFLAKHAGTVLGTLSLVPDNVLLGLPLESLYGAEVDALRAAGRRLVEVTTLADEGLSLREFTPVFVALMRLMAQYGLAHGADTWVITINPRHRLFYSRVMGFVPLGPCRHYPAVENHPAEAYLLDVPRLQANAPAMYQQLFGERLPQEALRPCPLPLSLVKLFKEASGQARSTTVDDILDYVDRLGSPRCWQ